MPKIAIITQYYKPEIGAPQNRLYELSSGLKKNGWEVVIITAMPNYPFGKVFSQYKGKLFCREYLDEIDVRRFCLYASNSNKIMPRIFSMLSFSITVLFSLRFLKKNRFDYILVESPPMLVGLSGYILSRFSKTRLILNVSDLWPLSAKELGAISNDFVYKKLEKLEHFLYKKSFICMGQSEEIVNHIKLHGASKTYLFRNGVDPQRFWKSPSDIGENSIKIVYAGLLGVAQGILEICKNINFNELRLEFHIYGAGNEEKELTKFIDDNNDLGIFYHGTVSSNEIPLILSNYSATLIPLAKNIYGAVPSKIYESMAAGLPIIFSGDGEGRLLIEKYDLGWTSSSRDYAALKMNLRNLSLQKEILKSKSKNCINAASTFFNRPKQIEELDCYLTSLID